MKSSESAKEVADCAGGDTKPMEKPVNLLCIMTWKTS